jgi:hypothetical protein
VRIYINEHFGSDGIKGIKPNAKQSTMYPLLKHRIKYNSVVLHQTKRLLCATNNIEHIAEELRKLYKKDIFHCTMQIRHPEWLGCVDTLGQIVERASGVIEQDMAFRRALIEPR